MKQMITVAITMVADSDSMANWMKQRVKEEFGDSVINIASDLSTADEQMAYELNCSNQNLFKKVKNDYNCDRMEEI